MQHVIGWAFGPESWSANRYLSAARRQAGQGMVEYALILVIVSIVAIFLMVSMGSQLTNMFTDVTTALGA